MPNRVEDGSVTGVRATEFKDEGDPLRIVVAFVRRHIHSTPMDRGDMKPEGKVAAGASRRRTCYVAAPAKLRRKPIEQTVRNAGCDPVEVTDLPVGGATPAAALMDALRRVDVVVGVFDEPDGDSASSSTHRASSVWSTVPYALCAA
jgi:hypothetical protein